MYELAYFDQLTLLPNRNITLINLKDSIKISECDNSKVVLFILDLDRFKNINDTLGHNFVDEIIKEIGNRLKKFKGKNLGNQFFKIIWKYILHLQ